MGLIVYFDENNVRINVINAINKIAVDKIYMIFKPLKPYLLITFLKNEKL